MNQVFGELLPLAVGVAISPIPVIAAILMLLAGKAGATSLGFLLGWPTRPRAAASMDHWTS